MCERPFSEYLKNSKKANSTHIGFTNYFTLTSVDAKNKPLLQNDSVRFGHFMANHRGFALEDAFKSLFVWLSRNHPTVSTTGIATEISIRQWNLLQNIAFSGVDTDADMVLESEDPPPPLTFLFFYIKSTEKNSFKKRVLKPSWPLSTSSQN